MRDGTRCRCGSFVWRPYGSYMRNSGDRVERVRCLECGSCRPKGVNRGGVGFGVGLARSKRRISAFEQFWDLVLSRFTIRGLPAALKSAQQELGVHSSTVSRWITRIVRPGGRDDDRTEIPRFAIHPERRYELLGECLRLAYGSADSRPQRSGDHPGEIELSYEDSKAVWALLVQARGTAALVRGDEMPYWLDRWAQNVFEVEERGLYPANAWSLRVRDIRDLGWHLLRQMPDQEWETAEAEDWLREWAERDRQQFLRQKLLRLESVEDQEDESDEDDEDDESDEDDEEDESDEHEEEDVWTEFKPEAVSELLLDHPPPDTLDRRRVEEVLRRTLSDLRAPIPRQKQHLDAELSYWLESDGEGNTKVSVANRRRLVGSAGPAKVKGLDHPAVIRLDPSRIQATKKTVEIPLSLSRFPSYLVLDKFS